MIEEIAEIEELLMNIRIYKLNGYTSSGWGKPSGVVRGRQHT